MYASELTECVPTHNQETTMYASELLIKSLKGQNRIIKCNIRAEKNRIKVMKRLHAQKIRLQTQWEKVASKVRECANELAR